MSVVLYHSPDRRVNNKSNWLSNCGKFRSKLPPETPLSTAAVERVSQPFSARPSGLDEHSLRLAEIAGGRGDDGLFADHQLPPGAKRRTHIVFADELGRCVALGRRVGFRHRG